MSLIDLYVKITLIINCTSYRRHKITRSHAYTRYHTPLDHLHVMSICIGSTADDESHDHMINAYNSSGYIISQNSNVCL